MAEEKQSLISKSDPKYRRQPPPPPVRPTRALHIAISLLILGGFVFYAQRNIPKHAPRIDKLQESYAICSKEGRKVYTVPEEGGVGGVECVVVRGKEVLDTGSLGRWICA
jgi:hypothetical protein